MFCSYLRFGLLGLVSLNTFSHVSYTFRDSSIVLMVVHLVAMRKPRIYVTCNIEKVDLVTRFIVFKALSTKEISNILPLIVL